MAKESGCCDSPSAVDAPLEYLTVENYDWPKPQAPKRSRLDEAERRRRHTECQKRSQARKQQFIKQLPRELAKLELMLKLAKAIRKTEVLLLERDQLVLQLTGPSASRPREEAMWPRKPSTLSVVDRVAESLNIDALVAELGIPEFVISL